MGERESLCFYGTRLGAQGREAKSEFEASSTLAGSGRLCKFMLAGKRDR